ncbi:MAG: phosphatase PAP2 family protein [Clostridia bacterium]|nr:phosphatase PAP2 family protein [Clostridia bacterium]
MNSEFDVEKIAMKNISKACAWEIRHLDLLHDKLYSSFMDKLMVFVTKTADMGTVWIVAALIMMLVEPGFKEGYTLLIALLLAIMIGNVIIKNIVRRNRPFFHKEYKLLIKQPRDYSFPSGHTLSSFTAATVIFLTNPWCGIIAFIYASLIALSRLYLRVHFFTDVGVSLVLGIVLGTVVHYVFKTGIMDFLPMALGK